MKTLKRAISLVLICLQILYFPYFPYKPHLRADLYSNFNYNDYYNYYSNYSSNLNYSNYYYNFNNYNLSSYYPKLELFNPLISPVKYLSFDTLGYASPNSFLTHQINITGDYYNVSNPRGFMSFNYGGLPLNFMFKANVGGYSYGEQMRFNYPNVIDGQRKDGWLSVYSLNDVVSNLSISVREQDIAKYTSPVSMLAVSWNNPFTGEYWTIGTFGSSNMKTGFWGFSGVYDISNFAIKSVSYAGFTLPTGTGIWATYLDNKIQDFAFSISRLAYDIRVPNVNVNNLIKDIINPQNVIGSRNLASVESKDLGKKLTDVEKYGAYYTTDGNVMQTINRQIRSTLSQGDVGKIMHANANSFIGKVSGEVLKTFQNFTEIDNYLRYYQPGYYVYDRPKSDYFFAAFCAPGVLGNKEVYNIVTSMVMKKSAPLDGSEKIRIMNYSFKQGGQVEEVRRPLHMQISTYDKEGNLIGLTPVLINNRQELTAAINLKNVFNIPYVSDIKSGVLEPVAGKDWTVRQLACRVIGQARTAVDLYASSLKTSGDFKNWQQDSGSTKANLSSVEIANQNATAQGQYQPKLPEKVQQQTDIYEIASGKISASNVLDTFSQEEVKAIKYQKELDSLMNSASGIGYIPSTIDKDRPKIKVSEERVKTYEEAEKLYQRADYLQAQSEGKIPRVLGGWLTDPANIPVVGNVLGIVDNVRTAYLVNKYQGQADLPLEVRLELIRKQLNIEYMPITVKAVLGAANCAKYVVEFYLLMTAAGAISHNLLKLPTSLYNPLFMTRTAENLGTWSFLKSMTIGAGIASFISPMTYESMTAKLIPQYYFSEDGRLMAVQSRYNILTAFLWSYAGSFGEYWGENLSVLLARAPVIRVFDVLPTNRFFRWIPIAHSFGGLGFELVEEWPSAFVEYAENVWAGYQRFSWKGLKDSLIITTQESAISFIIPTFAPVGFDMVHKGAYVGYRFGRAVYNTAYNMFAKAETPSSVSVQPNFNLSSNFAQTAIEDKVGTVEDTKNLEGVGHYGDNFKSVVLANSFNDAKKVVNNIVGTGGTTMVSSYEKIRELDNKQNVIRKRSTGDEFFVLFNDENKFKNFKDEMRKLKAHISITQFKLDNIQYYGVLIDMEDLGKFNNIYDGETVNRYLNYIETFASKKGAIGVIRGYSNIAEYLYEVPDKNSKKFVLNEKQIKQIKKFLSTAQTLTEDKIEDYCDTYGAYPLNDVGKIIQLASQQGVKQLTFRGVDDFVKANLDENGKINKMIVVDPCYFDNNGNKIDRFIKILNDNLGVILGKEQSKKLGNDIIKTIITEINKGQEEGLDWSQISDNITKGVNEKISEYDKELVSKKGPVRRDEEIGKQEYKEALQKWEKIKEGIQVKLFVIDVDPKHANEYLKYHAIIKKYLKENNNFAKDMQALCISYSMTEAIKVFTSEGIENLLEQQINMLNDLNKLEYPDEVLQYFIESHEELRACIEKYKIEKYKKFKDTGEVSKVGELDVANKVADKGTEITGVKSSFDKAEDKIIKRVPLIVRYKGHVYTQFLDITTDKLTKIAEYFGKDEKFLEKYRKNLKKLPNVIEIQVSDSPGRGYTQKRAERLINVLWAIHEKCKQDVEIAEIVRFIHKGKILDSNLYQVETNLNLLFNLPNPKLAERLVRFICTYENLAGHGGTAFYYWGSLYGNVNTFFANERKINSDRIGIYGFKIKDLEQAIIHELLETAIRRKGGVFDSPIAHDRVNDMVRNHYPYLIKRLANVIEQASNLNPNEVMKEINEIIDENLPIAQTYLEQNKKESSTGGSAQTYIEGSYVENRNVRNIELVKSANNVVESNKQNEGGNESRSGERSDKGGNDEGGDTEAGVEDETVKGVSQSFVPAQTYIEDDMSRYEAGQKIATSFKNINNVLENFDRFETKTAVNIIEQNVNEVVNVFSQYHSHRKSVVDFINQQIIFTSRFLSGRLSSLSYNSQHQRLQNFVNKYRELVAERLNGNLNRAITKFKEQVRNSPDTTNTKLGILLMPEVVKDIILLDILTNKNTDPKGTFRFIINKILGWIDGTNLKIAHNAYNDLNVKTWPLDFQNKYSKGEANYLDFAVDCEWLKLRNNICYLAAVYYSLSNVKVEEVTQQAQKYADENKREYTGEEIIKIYESRGGKFYVPPGLTISEVKDALIAYFDLRNGYLPDYQKLQKMFEYSKVVADNVGVIERKVNMVRDIAEISIEDGKGGKREINFAQTYIEGEQKDKQDVQAKTSAADIVNAWLEPYLKNENFKEIRRNYSNISRLYRILLEYSKHRDDVLKNLTQNVELQIRDEKDLQLWKDVVDELFNKCKKASEEVKKMARSEDNKFNHALFLFDYTKYTLENLIEILKSKNFGSEYYSELSQFLDDKKKGLDGITQGVFISFQLHNLGEILSDNTISQKFLPTLPSEEIEEIAQSWNRQANLELFKDYPNGKCSIINVLSVYSRAIAEINKYDFYGIFKSYLVLNRIILDRYKSWGRSVMDIRNSRLLAESVLKELYFSLSEQEKQRFEKVIKPFIKLYSGDFVSFEEFRNVVLANDDYSLNEFDKVIAKYREVEKKETVKNVKDENLYTICQELKVEAKDFESVIKPGDVRKSIDERITKANNRAPPGEIFSGIFKNKINQILSSSQARQKVDELLSCIEQEHPASKYSSIRSLSSVLNPVKKLLLGLADDTGQFEDRVVNPVLKEYFQTVAEDCEVESVKNFYLRLAKAETYGKLVEDCWVEYLKFYRDPVVVINIMSDFIPMLVELSKKDNTQLEQIVESDWEDLLSVQSGRYTFGSLFFENYRNIVTGVNRLDAYYRLRNGLIISPEELHSLTDVPWQEVAALKELKERMDKMEARGETKPRPQDLERTVFIIIGNGARAGKDTFAKKLQEKIKKLFGVEFPIKGTSEAIVLQAAEDKLINNEEKEYMLKNLETEKKEEFRETLIKLGNLYRENGKPPGVLAAQQLDGKPAIIVGVRNLSELQTTKEYLNKQGYQVIVVGIYNPYAKWDNTEFGLPYFADIIIPNLFDETAQYTPDVARIKEKILSDYAYAVAKRMILPSYLPQDLVVLSRKVKDEEFNKDIVYLDIETTGLSKDSQLVEICIRGYKKGIKGDVIYYAKVKPQHGLSAEERQILKEVLKYTDRDIVDLFRYGQPLEKVLAEVSRILNNKTVVVHNASFDLDFLKAKIEEVNSCGAKINFPVYRGVIDTKSIAQFLNFRLTHLKNLYEQLLNNAEYSGHSAVNDTMVLYTVFNEMMKRIDNRLSSLKKASEVKVGEVKVNEVKPSGELAQTYIEEQDEQNVQIEKEVEYLKQQLKEEFDENFAYENEVYRELGRLVVGLMDNTLPEKVKISKEAYEVLNEIEKKNTKYIEGLPRNIFLMGNAVLSWAKLQKIKLFKKLEVQETQEVGEAEKVAEVPKVSKVAEVSEVEKEVKEVKEIKSVKDLFGKFEEIAGKLGLVITGDGKVEWPSPRNKYHARITIEDASFARNTGKHPVYDIWWSPKRQRVKIYIDGHEVNKNMLYPLSAKKVYKMMQEVNEYLASISPQVETTEKEVEEDKEIAKVKEVKPAEVDEREVISEQINRQVAQQEKPVEYDEKPKEEFEIPPSQKKQPFLWKVGQAKFKIVNVVNPIKIKEKQQVTTTSNRIEKLYEIFTDWPFHQRYSFSDMLHSALSKFSENYLGKAGVKYYIPGVSLEDINQQINQLSERDFKCFKGYFSSYLKATSQGANIDEKIRVVGFTDIVPYCKKLEVVKSLEEIKKDLPKVSKVPFVDVKLPPYQTEELLEKVVKQFENFGEVVILADYDEEYGQKVRLNYIRIVVLSQEQKEKLGDKVAGMSSDRLKKEKIAFVDIPVGDRVLRTAHGVSYPAGYFGIYSDKEYEIISAQDYVLNLVLDCVSSLLERGLDKYSEEFKVNLLRKTLEYYRIKINQSLQMLTLEMHPLHEIVTPLNKYRVVVLKDNGTPFSEGIEFKDAVLYCSKAYFDLQEQGYDAKVYKADKGVLTLYPDSYFKFSDPGKKHFYSALNSLQTNIKDLPSVKLLSNLQADGLFSSGVLFILGQEGYFNDLQDMFGDGCSILNAKSEFWKGKEILVPQSVTVRIKSGNKELLPVEILKFLDLRKKLAEVQGKERDEVLQQLKDLYIDGGESRFVVIGDRIIYGSKFYISDVVVGDIAFDDAYLIVRGYSVLSPNDVSYNLGYGGLKTVPNVKEVKVFEGRNEIDVPYISSVKVDDERLVEILLHKALNEYLRLSHFGVRDTNIDSLLDKAGVEIEQQDGAIYGYRVKEFRNENKQLYSDIINAIDKLLKEKEGQGLVRKYQISYDGKTVEVVGVWVKSLPVTVSATYRYPMSMTRLDAKFFGYVALKYGQDLAEKIFSGISNEELYVILSGFASLAKMYNCGFEDFEFTEIPPELLEKAKTSPKEFIKEVMRSGKHYKFTLPDKCGVITTLYFPYVGNVEYDEYLNQLEKAIINVVTSPDISTVHEYAKFLTKWFFTKEGKLRNVYNVENRTVFNFPLVAAKGGEIFEVELSKKALRKYKDYDKLEELAKEGRLYAIICRHPLIVPDAVMVVKVKIVNSEVPLKIHPWLWALMKGDFDKDSAVMYISLDVQNQLATAYEGQLKSEYLRKRIEEEGSGIKQDFCFAEDVLEAVQSGDGKLQVLLEKALEKLETSGKEYDIASVIATSLRLLTGSLHWKLYELREFVHDKFFSGELSEDEYYVYVNILWKIEQQAISGKKVKDIFTVAEIKNLNSKKVSLREKGEIVRQALEREGLTKSADLLLSNRIITPQDIKEILGWQKYVSKKARLSDDEINRLIMLSNWYSDAKAKGLIQRYREGIAKVMTIVDISEDVNYVMENPYLNIILSHSHDQDSPWYWAFRLLGLDLQPIKQENVEKLQQVQQKQQVQSVQQVQQVQHVEQIQQEAQQKVQQETQQVVQQKQQQVQVAEVVQDVIQNVKDVKQEVEQEVRQKTEQTLQNQQVYQKQHQGVIIDVSEGLPIFLRSKTLAIINDSLVPEKGGEKILEYYAVNQIVNAIEKYNQFVIGKKIAFTEEEKRIIDLILRRYYGVNYADLPYKVAISKKELGRILEHFVVKCSLKEAVKLIDKYNLKIDNIIVDIDKVGNIWEFVKLLSEKGVKNFYFVESKGSYSFSTRPSYSTYVKYQGSYTSIDIDRLIKKEKISWWRNLGLATALSALIGTGYFFSYKTHTISNVPVEVKAGEEVRKIVEGPCLPLAYLELQQNGLLRINLPWDNLALDMKRKIIAKFQEKIEEYYDRNKDGYIDRSIFLNTGWDLFDLRIQFNDIAKEVILSYLGKSVTQTTQVGQVGQVERVGQVEQDVQSANPSDVQSVDQSQQVNQSASQADQTMQSQRQIEQEVIPNVKRIYLSRTAPNTVYVVTRYGIGVEIEFFSDDKNEYESDWEFINETTLQKIHEWWQRHKKDLEDREVIVENFEVKVKEFDYEVSTKYEKDRTSDATPHKLIITVNIDDVIKRQFIVKLGSRGGIRSDVSQINKLPQDVVDEIWKQIGEIKKKLGLPSYGGGVTTTQLKEKLEQAFNGNIGAVEWLEKYFYDNPTLFMQQLESEEIKPIATFRDVLSLFFVHQVIKDIMNGQYSQDKKLAQTYIKANGSEKIKMEVYK